MSRLIVVSADGHAGALPEGYREYLEEPYRDSLQDLEREQEAFLRDLSMSVKDSVGPERMPYVDVDDAVNSFGESGGWDLDRRVKELDGQGVAAEVVPCGHQNAVQPFFSIVNQPHPHDLRAAGARAFHRWLADGIADSDGRLIGVGEPGPCLDMAEIVRELRWIADHGFKGVNAPGNTGDDALPPLHDAYYNPFWAACEELGLAVLVHAGWGHRQGAFQEFAGSFLNGMVGADENFYMKAKEAMASAASSPLALDMGPRRLLWQLMLGGVFDRFPHLRFVLTEVRADRVPGTLRHLDKWFDRGGTPLKLRPSEYWQRNCFTSPSSIHLAEVEMRQEIGINQMMFGVDFPHPESVWPNTLDWIRASFAGVPVDEASRILGLNAIECFDLDLDKLAAIAERIGPDSDDVLAPEHNVDPRLIEHFHFRAGFSRPAEEVDPTRIDPLFEEDLHAVKAAAAH